jgi:hypothetical protein
MKFYMSVFLCIGFLLSSTTSAKDCSDSDGEGFHVKVTYADCTVKYFDVCGVEVPVHIDVGSDQDPEYYSWGYGRSTDQLGYKVSTISEITAREKNELLRLFKKAGVRLPEVLKPEVSKSFCADLKKRTHCGYWKTKSNVVHSCTCSEVAKTDNHNLRVKLKRRPYRTAESFMKECSKCILYEAKRNKFKNKDVMLNSTANYCGHFVGYYSVKD